MVKFSVRANHENADQSRYFLVEAPDERLARALFVLDHSGWHIEASREARCFSGGEHKGSLSVWEGQDGKTAVLCQAHGDPH